MNIETAAVLSNCGMLRDGMVTLLKQNGVQSCLGVKRLNELMELLDSTHVGAVVVDLEHLVEEARTIFQNARRHPKNPKLVAWGTAVQLASIATLCDWTLECPIADAGSLNKCLDELSRAGEGTLRWRPIREGQCAPKEDPREWSKVTSRQREVLGWLSQGADNERIAKILHISIRTVKAHVSGLMRRFEVENRTELALLAQEAGVHPLPMAEEAAASGEIAAFSMNSANSPRSMTV
jgi:DNA-binding NarL/FixJ family response regulator